MVVKVVEGLRSAVEVVKVEIDGGGGETKVIDSVLYRSVRPEYTVQASNPVRSTPLFHTGKNTSRTGEIWLYQRNTFFFLFYFS